MGDQLGLKDAVDERVTFLRWTKVQSLHFKSSEPLSCKTNERALTNQSSRKLDIAMLLILLSETLRSIVYTV